jgi:hypothetical protein
LLRGNWWRALARINEDGLPLVFPVGLVGLVFLVCRDAKRALFLGLWVMPCLFLYSGYYWLEQSQGYVRFFVGISAPLILSALFLLCRIPKHRVWRPVVIGLFVLLAAIANLRLCTQMLGRHRGRLLFNKTMSDTVRTRLSSRSVIFSEPDILNVIEYVGEYRLYSLQLFESSAIQKVAEGIGRAEPSPLQERRARALVELLGGKSDSQLADIERELMGRHLAEGREVALIIQRDRFGRVRDRVGEKLRFEPLAEWNEERVGDDGAPRSVSWELFRLRSSVEQSHL